MSSIGNKSTNQEVNKLISRLNQIIRELEERVDKLEKGT